MKTKLTVKQILAVALSLLMVLAVSIPAFADGPYKITITNHSTLKAMVDGQFTAYQIFKGTVKENSVTGTGDGTQGTMTNIEWASGVKSADLLSALKTSDIADKFTAYLATLDVANEVAGIEGMSASQVAEVLEANKSDLTFVRAFAKVAYGNLGTGKSSNAINNGAASEMSVAELGYYIVVQDKALSNEDGTDSFYSSLILQVIEKDTVVYLKGNVPTVEKEAEVPDAGVGDIVKFTLTATLPTNFSDYNEYYLKFNDTLNTGLELVKDTTHPIEVKIGTGDALADTFYKLTATDKGTTLAVEFENLKADAFKNTGVGNGVKITVTYYARITAAAVTTNVAENTVYLDYTNNPNTQTHGKTVDEKEYVHNFNVDITKQGSDGKLLENAEFYLTKSVGGKTYYATADTNGNFTGWVEQTADDVDDDGNAIAPATASTFKSDSNGKISIKGIDAGEYTLIEAVAPTNYSKIPDVTFKIEATYSEDGSTVENVTFTITDSATRTDVKDVTVYTDKTVGEEGQDQTTVKVNATHSVSLLLIDPADSDIPNTGGIGTVIFYVMGGLMVLGAVAYLVISKKKVRA